MIGEALRMLRLSLLISLVIGPLACGGSAKPKSDEPTASQAGPVHGPDAHHPQTHGHHAHGDKPLGHRFENAEEWAKRFDDPSRDAWQKPADVVALMEITPGMTVADVGAGTGYFLPCLSKAVGDTGTVLGLDIEADMVRYMEMRADNERLGNVKARTVAVADPELSLGSVDRVLIVDTWHHIPDRIAYAKKLAKGLRPGGAVFIVDFTMETERGPHKDHRLSRESIVAELAEAGLATDLLDEELPDQFIVRGRLP